MCWSMGHTLRNRDPDSLGNPREEKYMQIVTNFALLAHVIYADQKTLSFRAKSFIVIAPSVSPPLHFTPANGANGRLPSLLRL